MGGTDRTQRSANGRGGRGRVLVADRRSEARGVLVQMLRDEGFDVEVADDAWDLERRLAGGTQAIDLVLWGFDPRDAETERAADWLTARRPKAVVLMSARGWLATASAAVRLGASAVVRRPLGGHPVGREALQSALRDAFA